MKLYQKCINIFQYSDDSTSRNTLTHFRPYFMYTFEKRLERAPWRTRAELRRRAAPAGECWYGSDRPGHRKASSRCEQWARRPAWPSRLPTASPSLCRTSRRRAWWPDRRAWPRSLWRQSATRQISYAVNKGWFRSAVWKRRVVRHDIRYCWNK